MTLNSIQNDILYIEQMLNRYYSADKKLITAKAANKRDYEEIIDEEIYKFKEYLKANDDLHQIFMEEFQGFSYDEVFLPRHFSNDLHNFILRLKQI